ncbi:MAG: HD domain-containing phosphohydrolase [Desulfomonilia bacterium]|nr:HD domain-containing protein [Deltaproteobacteria bacterium]MDX9761091.1 HD domain-containing protein [Desulfomonilia bacterium]
MEKKKRGLSVSPRAKHTGQDQGIVFRDLPLSMMRINERYDFDIYLQIRGDYRLFAARGALFTDQHSKLLTDGSIRLYVKDDEWDRVEEYQTSYLSRILADPAVDSRDKASVAFTASMRSIREIFRSVEPRTIRDVEKNAEEMVRLILSEEEVMENLIWIESHDHFTYQHSVRVGIYATALTIKLFSDKLTKQGMAALSAGYFLHDIGMAQIPMRILEKSSPLTPSEWGLIRMHPMWGYDRLLETGHLTPEAAAIVLSHHERHDGSGYPFAREGDGIPAYAKICAIVDTFESLTAPRPYRESVKPFHALKIMQQEMAAEFDAEMFKSFILLLGPGG